MTSEERDDLILKYLAGTMTAQEQEAFEKELRSDRAMPRRVAELSIVDTQLTELGKSEKLAARIEQGPIVAEIRPGRTESRRSWAWVPMAAAAALLLAAGMGWWLAGAKRGVEGPVVARVEKVSGTAFQVSGGKQLKLKAGGEVRAGDQVGTEKGATIKLQYPGEETSVDLSGSSSIVCGRAGDGAKRLNLERGRLNATVAKQPAGKPFVITTPQAEITVVGTIFSLESMSDRTRLTVQDGKVAMRSLVSGGTTEQVAAGQTSVSKAGAGKLTVPGRVVRHVDVRSWGLGFPDGVAYDGSSVWLYFSQTGMLCSMDPETCKDTARVKLEHPFPPDARGIPNIAFDGRNIWGWATEGLLRAVDTGTGKTVKELKLDGPQERGNPFDMRQGEIWIWFRHMNCLMKFEAATGKKFEEKALDLGFPSSYLALDTGVAFFAARRAGDIAVYSASDYTRLWRVSPRNQWWGGDMAYDPERGLWISTDMGGLFLVEAE